MRLVDRQNPRKLYLQLSEIIQEAIDRGEVVPGQQLSTEDQLCVQQGVSKAVVRSALLDLTRKGYIRKIPGKGTFALKPIETQGIRLSCLLTENMLDFGIDWQTEVIQKMLSVPPTDLSELFTMESGHQVVKVIRLRKIDDLPVVLDTSYVSNDLCPGLQLEDFRSSSLLDIITQKFKVVISRCADSLEITTLEEREAAILKKKSGEYALLADRILYTSNNRVAAFIRILSVSSKYRITYESIRGS